MAAFLLGGGIWSMHFLAMLSIQFTVPIHYDMLQTLSSGLIAVLVVGYALLLLHFKARTSFILNMAGLCLGIGIVSMHIVGMLGMRGVIPDFNNAALLLSFILALLMGVVAIRVSYGIRSRQNIVKGGLLFGFSVVVVHYTAMLGTHFSLDPDYQQPSIALDQGALAIAVTVAAFVICGTFLLATSTFGPSAEQVKEHTGNDVVDGPRDRIEQQFRESSPIMVDAPESEWHSGLNKTTTMVDDISATATMTADDAISKMVKQKPDDIPGEGFSKDGLLFQNPDSETQLDGAVSGASGTILHIKIPYEQQKQIFFVSCAEVGAIRADGRYTQLYTRDGVKFCPWSISEAEKRLANARFYRSHRSYLINLPAVTSFEKNRDSGMCRFEGFAQLSNVPVSRSRVGELVTELGL